VRGSGREITVQAESSSEARRVVMETKPQLTDEQRARAVEILENTRQAIANEAGGDPLLEFAMRRYIYVRLSYDERGKPMQRRKLKAKLFDLQQGRCPLCGESIVTLGETELHRAEASAGYSEENVSLVHHACHRKQQADKNSA
jgi:hypothetical protein